MIAKMQISKNPIKRVIFVLSSVLIFGLSVLVWYTINVQIKLVETSALESAKLYSQALAEFRTIYTSEVVQKVDPHPDFEVNATRIRLMSTPESGHDLRGYAASKRRAAPSFGETVLVVV